MLLTDSNASSETRTDDDVDDIIAEFLRRDRLRPFSACIGRGARQWAEAQSVSGATGLGSELQPA